MAAFSFPAFEVSAQSTRAKYLIRVDIEQWTVGGALPTFGTLTAAALNPFTKVKGIKWKMEAEAGTFGPDDVEFECTNETFNSTNMLTMLIGLDPRDVQLWLRIMYSTDGGSTYTEAWRGVAVHRDVEELRPDPTDATSYLYKFKAMTWLSRMDNVSVDNFVDNKLLLATYNVTPANGVTISKQDGATVTAHSFFFMWQNVTVGTPDWRPASELRFFNLQDIVQAMSEHIGVTGTAQFDCDWEFVAHDGVSDVTFGFEDLHIVSETYHSGVHEQYGGFFDPDKPAQSFRTLGSMLEMLKAILLPFGMLPRLIISGASYYLQCAQVESAAGYAPGNSVIIPPVKMTTADRSLDGIKVTTPNVGSTSIGTTGDGGTAMRCMFMTANNMPNDWEWTVASGAGHTRFSQLVTQSLYGLDGTYMRSIYKIIPKTHGTGTVEHDGSYNVVGAGLVPAKAMAAYWFNESEKYSANRVGVYRPWMRRIELEIDGLATGVEAGDYVTYGTIDWWIVELEWDFETGTTKIKAESPTW